VREREANESRFSELPIRVNFVLEFNVRNSHEVYEGNKGIADNHA
jgi:hypothetical protein